MLLPKTITRPHITFIWIAKLNSFNSTLHTFVRNSVWHATAHYHTAQLELCVAARCQWLPGRVLRRGKQALEESWMKLVEHTGKMKRVLCTMFQIWVVWCWCMRFSAPWKWVMSDGLIYVAHYVWKMPMRHNTFEKTYFAFTLDQMQMLFRIRVYLSSLYLQNNFNNTIPTQN